MTHPRLCPLRFPRDWDVCRSQRCVEAGQVRPYRYGRVPLCSPCPMKRTAGLAPQRLRFSMRLQSSRPRLERSPKRFSWRMRCATFPRRYAAASHGRSSPRRLAASAPRWSTGPPWATCSNRWPCLKSRPRRGAVPAPGSALAAHSGLWVRSAVAPPFPPSPAHLSSARAHAPPNPPHPPPRPNSQSLLPRPATC